MERRDSVDDHLDRWVPLLPHLDPHRRQSTVDRRRVDVELTADGGQAWRSATDVVGCEEHRIPETLTDGERKWLSGLLHRLLVVAENPEPVTGKR
jgi:hypothetical protein